MSLHRLSGLDTAFLVAERSGNPLHMMGVLVLDPSTVPGGYSFEGFRRFLAERLPALAPLRRRLVEVPGGLARPYWSDVGDVELDYHVRRVAVPAPGGTRELAAMASAMMERPLDRRLPLWEMQVVEGLEGGRVALLAKLSHAMMDGTAGVALMAQLVSTKPELPALRDLPPVEAGEVPGPVELIADSLPWLARQPLRAASAGVGTIKRMAAGMRRSPKEKGEGSSRPANDERPDIEVHRTWLNDALSPFRELAWCSLPMERLRAVGHAHDATVNDALLASVSGALRRYALAHDKLPDFPLIASVPVALREPDNERANAITALSIGLATELNDPVERLERIRAATSARKGERGGTLGEYLAPWVDVPPPLLFSLATSAYFDLDLASRMTPLCNLVVSSVPGPPGALYFAGARLDAIYPLGPIFTGMALNFTAISCGDSLHVGLVACRKAVPDLWTLADGLSGALDELAATLAA